MRKRARGKQALSVLLLAACLVGPASFCAPAARALSESGRTIRVAYPIQKKLTDIDEAGNYCGYTYEYLEEIAQYTGWDYEFVQVKGDLNEQLVTLMDMVERGEVDLMGDMLYSEAMGERFDYASHSYGVSETVLQVPVENASEVQINSQVMQTLRVAVLNAKGRMAQELEDYCKMNLIEPVYVLCEDNQGQLEAVRSGRADVLLNVSLNYIEGVRTIARFAPKPFYFVMPKDAGIAVELSQAILDIEQSDPYFSTALLEKYFSSATPTLQLTQKERAYIAQSEPVRVGVPGHQPPYQYRDGDSGKLSGISIDLLQAISEKTGLRFEYVYAESAAALNRLSSNGEIDLVAGVPYQYETAQAQNLSMTRPYVSAQYILVTTAKYGKQNVVGKRLALPASALYANRAAGEVIYCADTAACFKAIRDGKADYTYVDAYTAQYFINLPAYSALKLAPQTFSQHRVCYGVVKPGKRELLGILNKAIVTMPTEELQALVNRNTIMPQPHPINAQLQQTMYILVAVLTLLLVGFGAYYVSSRRSEKKLMAAKALAERAYDQAAKASLAKSEFLSRMSHEIRTPMNGISGMTAIAMRNIGNQEKVADCLEKVQLSSNHLLALINDILDMAKIESGKLEFHQNAFNFQGFLDNLTSLYDGQAVEKGLTFRTTVSGQVSGALVGDALRLNQILGNLLSNACKFTPAGGSVTLSVTELSRSADIIWMRFRVADTGCGIPPGDLEVIFDAFEQGGGNVSLLYGGTGLGLSIVKRFTEAMGGRVAVESQLGAGSVFTVELPFGNPGEAGPAAGAPGFGVHAAGNPPAGAPEAFDFTGYRILLAEDNALNREIALELVGATGAAIEPAVDGAEAVERFAASPVGYYDLILMDIQMPRMNGYAATGKIRAMDRPDAARVPILAMTADAFAEDEEKCLATGMNGHLSKPIDVNILYGKLREALGKS